jgi:hypothetical protein
MGPRCYRGCTGGQARGGGSSAQPPADPDDLRREPLATSRSRNTAAVQFFGGLPCRHLGKPAEDLAKPLSAFSLPSVTMSEERLRDGYSAQWRHDCRVTVSRLDKRGQELCACFGFPPFS